MGKEQKDEQQIRVEDKRRFDADGNPVSASDPAGGSEQQAEEQSEAGSAFGSHGPGPSHSPEHLSFISVLFSYIHSALIYLGDIEDPVQHNKVESLDGARHMIAILELLEQKTKGNLTTDERQYLESALFDLRMRYMQKANLIK